VSNRRVFVGSGDGYAYAFEAATGKLLWRFRAAPTERKIPVYGSLQSTWPVATGVLVSSNVAYFAAGMNNYDGTHVYALDTESGAIKWQNSNTGGTGASVGVQGDLLLFEDRLYLAGGSAASPAVYDIIDGRCLSKGKKNRSGRELRLSAPKNKDGETLKRHIVAVGQPFYSIPSRPVFRRLWAPGKDLELEWPDTIVETANLNLLVRQTRDSWRLDTMGCSRGCTRSHRRSIARQPSTLLWQSRIAGEESPTDLNRIFVKSKNTLSCTGSL
jgi:hypothetical protein